jgi:hypothetical protein
MAKQPGVVKHTCNPSYLGGRGRRMASWRSAQAYLKNKIQRGWGHHSRGRVLRPRVQSPVPPKRRKRRRRKKKKKRHKEEEEWEGRKRKRRRKGTAKPNPLALADRLRLTGPLEHNCTQQTFSFFPWGLFHGSLLLKVLQGAVLLGEACPPGHQ